MYESHVSEYISESKALESNFGLIIQSTQRNACASQSDRSALQQQCENRSQHCMVLIAGVNMHVGVSGRLFVGW